MVPFHVQATYAAVFALSWIPQVGWIKEALFHSNYNSDKLTISKYKIWNFRKNMDQGTLQAVMDIMKGYVRAEDGDFPQLSDVVNFKFAFWEDKIFQKVLLTVK